MTEIHVDLKDVLGNESVVHNAEIVVHDYGISIFLYRQGEEIAIGSILVENHQGDLQFHAWTNGEADGDPTYYHNFTEDNSDFCMKCGGDWINHNDDGSCVDEG